MSNAASDPTAAAARALLEKVRRFIADELDADERKLFAALLAPGVASAFDEAEVSGFGVTSWSPAALPEALAAAVRADDSITRRR